MIHLNIGRFADDKHVDLWTLLERGNTRSQETLWDSVPAQDGFCEFTRSATYLPRPALGTLQCRKGVKLRQLPTCKLQAATLLPTINVSSTGVLD